MTIYSEIVIKALYISTGWSMVTVMGDLPATARQETTMTVTRFSLPYAIFSSIVQQEEAGWERLAAYVYQCKVTSLGKTSTMIWIYDQETSEVIQVI